MMYGSRAELYDRIYHWKDYAAEAGRVRALLAEAGVADGATLLDAGCGTGSHLAALRAWYRVSGFDSSAAMLEVARRKLPDVPLFEADLADFTVPAPVDAITCLFGGIGYVYPRARLESSAAAFARALRPGGVLVLEPFVSPERFVPGRPYVQTFDGPDLELRRTSMSRVEGELAVIDFTWRVQRPHAPAEHFEETHRLWLTPTAVLTAAFEGAGLKVTFDRREVSDDRGTLIARRR